MCLLLALHYTKCNDGARDKHGIKYIPLPKCTNILLGYLFWLLLGWLLLTFNPKKTPLGETGWLSKLYLFAYWFLRRPVF